MLSTQASIKQLRGKLRSFRPGDQRYIYFHKEDLDALANLISDVKLQREQIARLEKATRRDAVTIVNAVNELLVLRKRVETCVCSSSS